MDNQGCVFLVGAGPGDPELLTLKALELIKTADTVVYDRLVSAEILELIPDNVDRIDVGKRPGSHPVPQKSINRILVKLARSGQKVVRLKGGDPMIFGRGGEEVEILLQHSVEVRTVPGITSAQGCASSLNLPLTQRGIANSLMYLTGHTRDDIAPDINWAPVVAGTTTAVIYMGVATISEITSEMIAAGLDEDTPALAVCNATRPAEQHLLSSVARIADEIKLAEFEGPVLFVIGKAAGLAAYNGELQDGRLDEPAAAASL